MSYPLFHPARREDPIGPDNAATIKRWIADPDAMGGAWHPECEPLAAAFRAAVAELAGGPRKTEDPFK